MRGPLVIRGRMGPEMNGRWGTLYPPIPSPGLPLAANSLIQDCPAVYLNRTSLPRMNLQRPTKPSYSGSLRSSRSHLKLPFLAFQDVGNHTLPHLDPSILLFSSLQHRVCLAGSCVEFFRLTTPFADRYPYWRGDSYATQWERPCESTKTCCHE